MLFRLRLACGLAGGAAGKRSLNPNRGKAGSGQMAGGSWLPRHEAGGAGIAQRAHRSRPAPAGGRFSSPAVDLRFGGRGLSTSVPLDPLLAGVLPRLRLACGLTGGAVGKCSLDPSKGKAGSGQTAGSPWLPRHEAGGADIAQRARRPRPASAGGRSSSPAADLRFGR